MTILFWLSAATLILTVPVALDLYRGNRSVAALRDVPPDPSPCPPCVSILLRTMLLNLWQGGIYWRGTFYSLKKLKTNKV